jgi:hypothetical protein
LNFAAFNLAFATFHFEKLFPLRPNLTHWRERIQQRLCQKDTTLWQDEQRSASKASLANVAAGSNEACFKDDRRMVIFNVDHDYCFWQNHPPFLVDADILRLKW